MRTKAAMFNELENLLDDDPSVAQTLLGVGSMKLACGMLAAFAELKGLEVDRQAVSDFLLEVAGMEDDRNPDEDKPANQEP
ncbi:hypothetical protein [Parapusillimonas granuli]|uniref:Uncharacterized protein n=1 Tax=Parapusillimonas granuli TaxID=380911 RepID=A0A853G3E1_9BURK|nr:hypothetical protein [Parapusillimonas granuli]MBB5214279.1 hypothetical protein [Parapusillimonas granuli]MEB2399106.1 hypothetical protein [Alcaligenaceae bacterium]NYT51383.1 hypothetical protein [Parapusillimonas granuli]